mmetsp:Transcript_12842/g.29288  ORF Transcript_12842/g.29288 Transcript_12842/m.29288 type:complete len:200 (-) Transcript_12842:8-607(-)
MRENRLGRAARTIHSALGRRDHGLIRRGAILLPTTTAFVLRVRWVVLTKEITRVVADRVARILAEGDLELELERGELCHVDAAILWVDATTELHGPQTVRRIADVIGAEPLVQTGAVGQGACAAIGAGLICEGAVSSILDGAVRKRVQTHVRVQEEGGASLCEDHLHRLVAAQHLALLVERVHAHVEEPHIVKLCVGHQ